MTALALLAVLPTLAPQGDSPPPREQVPETRRPRIEELLPGIRIEVKGGMETPGVFRGEDFELVEPGERDTLFGPIDEIRAEAGQLRVMGLRVEVPRTADVRREGGTRAGLGDLSAGEWVKVEGFFDGKRFRARRVRAEEPRSRVTLLGVIEEVERGPEQTRLRLLGVEVVARPRARVDVPEGLQGRDLESLAQEPPSRRRRTEEDFVPGSIRPHERVTLGGTVSTKVERKEDFDLDPDDEGNRTDPELRTRLEATWRPRDDLWIVAGFADAREWQLREEEENRRARRTVLRETFVFLRDLGGVRGLDVEAGRLHFKDERQWLYDRDLDGVRLALDRRPFYLEGSLTTVALGGARTEKDEETTNAMALATLDLGDLGEIEAYAIDRQDRTREENSPFFVGVRGRGEPFDGVEPWFEAAYATGVDDRERIRGYGFDAGATLVARHPLEPALTVGYAFGSGGDRDPSDGDANFRQTGLQDNVDKWNGVTSFQYYGELLDPELSNLEVVTAGVGFRPARRTSLDFAVHRYRQPRPAPFLRDAELRDSPNGSDGDLGWEWDAVFGWRRLRFLDLELVFGRFHPGDAFEDDRAASFLKFELRFKF